MKPCSQQKLPLTLGIILLLRRVKVYNYKIMDEQLCYRSRTKEVGLDGSTKQPKAGRKSKGRQGVLGRRDILRAAAEEAAAIEAIQEQYHREYHQVGWQWQLLVCYAGSCICNETPEWLFNSIF